MNIATFSPALVLLFICALLCILMDIRFRNLTKTQKWLVPILILILCVFNHTLRLKLGSVVYGKLIFLTMHLPYFLIFLYLAKCGVVKMVFMIFSAVVFMAPAIYIGNAVKAAFSASSAALLLANLISYTVMLLLAHFLFRPGFNYLIKHGDNQFFLRFSLVPLLYYIYLFAAMNLDFSAFNSVGGYVVRLLPTVYVFVFYFLLLRNHKEINEKKELEAVQTALRQQLSSAEAQIEHLNKAHIQTAIYQHDIRHHLTAIDSFLSAGNSRQAAEYIRKVHSDLESITPKRFCENELVNLLCSSFSQRAEQMEVRLDVKVTVPEKLSVSDTELCSILSNGLDNALRAADQMEAPYRSVEFYCGVRRNKMLIEIKNRCAGEVVMEDGLPVSREKGHGYGCRSIRIIAERNRGHCAFEQEHDVFVLRVVLPVAEQSER